MYLHVCKAKNLLNFNVNTFCQDGWLLYGIANAKGALELAEEMLKYWKVG